MTALCCESPNASGPPRADSEASRLASATPTLGRWVRAENGVLATLLTAMIALPLAEIVLRQFSIGIPNAPEFLRHLTLWVGMLGGSIAAREGRLLVLANGTRWLPGAWQARAEFAAGCSSAAVSALLAVASTRFVLQERAGGAELAYGIPLWLIQIAMPLGFAAIAVRIGARRSDSAGRRVFAAIIVVLLATAGALAPTSFALVALIVATAFGAPIFVTIGGAALLLFWGNHVPVTTVAIDHYGLVTNPTLPAIPLFTIAGYFMAEGGASRRLVQLFQSLSGWIRGGPAIATALICAFFTAFTGGSGVTILAMAGLLMPVLVAARLSERNALGLLTGAGSLGILLPPCLPIVLYAILAKVDINTMFLAGVLPGVLLIALTAAWGIWVTGPAPKIATTAAESSHASAPAIRRALWDAKWELLMPVVSLTVLFSGWATAVEAAAVTAAYAFIVEIAVHRELRPLADAPRVMSEAGLLVGGILLILGVALGLTNYLIDAGVPHRLADWSVAHVHSRGLFLLGLNVLLIVVGSVVEIYAAIVVVAPLLVPVGARLGVDPVHLGIIFLANMELGFLAPPVGLNLLLASSRLKRPVSEVARATLPLLAVMFVGVLLITYWPALTLWLPRLFSSST